jgi:stage II sporulation protein M
MGAIIMNLKEKISTHLKNNLGLYLVLTAIYVAGVVFGALGVGALQPEHQKDLAGFIQKSFTELTTSAPQGTLGDLLWENLKVIVAVYILGMSIIGMPLIFVILFTRGFVMGFAVGFLVQSRAVQGIFLTLMTILPPSLINIPVLLITSLWAINFSLSLVRGTKGWRGRDLTRQFAIYSGAIVLMALFACLGALLQGYLSPLMLKVVLAYASAQ